MGGDDGEERRVKSERAPERVGEGLDLEPQGDGLVIDVHRSKVDRACALKLFLVFFPLGILDPVA